MKRSTVLNRGDIVTITPENFTGNKPPFDIVVTEVNERYGVYPRGIQINHLVIGTRVDNGERAIYDFGFITEIKSRAKQKLGLPKNIYRRQKQRNQPIREKGKISMTLIVLLKNSLGKLPYHIERKINEEKFYKLFDVQKPGVIDDIFGMVTVNEKVFDKWVRKNYTRFLETTKELVVAGTEKIRRDESEMRAWMRADMEAEMMADDPIEVKMARGYEYDYQD